MSPMLLVTGADQSVLDRVCRSLADQHFDRAHHIDFDRAWRARATTLLHVEELPRLAGPPPAPPQPLTDLVEAAEAPSVRRVILVTARDDLDEDLRLLRRSGVPYLILRPAPLLEVDAFRADIEGRRILVPEEVARQASTALPVDALVDAIRAALGDPDDVGRVAAVQPSESTSWLDLLAASGARPQVVGRWRAHIGHWLGQPMLGMAGGRVALHA
jgi:hypothetical protein